jgi:hypothetical protein
MSIGSSGASLAAIAHSRFLALTRNRWEADYPAGDPNGGVADSLDEAKAAFRRRGMQPLPRWRISLLRAPGLLSS